MKVIVQTGAESVEVRERHRPDIADDEVLVAVHSTGVCGSDAHAYLYHDGYEWVQLPRVMGHEYAGTVESVGAGVTDLSPGDRVVEDPTRRCGRCFQCRNGQENVCRNFSVKGMHRDGSYAEFTDSVGFDLVFDTTGHRSGVETAVEQVRKGGQIVVVGLPGESSNVPMADVVRSEVEVATSYGSVWRNFERALSLLESGTVDPEPVVDTSFAVDDPDAAFAAFLDSKTTKPVFTFRHD